MLVRNPAGSEEGQKAGFGSKGTLYVYQLECPGSSLKPQPDLSSSLSSSIQAASSFPASQHPDHQQVW